MNIEIKEKKNDKGVLCNNVLRSLPDWFGIESAIINYANEIQKMTVFVAMDGDNEIGLLSLHEHNGDHFEIHVMGILSDYHGKGIGHQLIEKAESFLNEKCVKYFSVKTLSPSRDNEAYAKTRTFYKSVGFVSFEEFKELWGESNPCLVMIKTIL